MEQLLMELARTARLERAVATQPLDNGMQLLVYPLADGVLVGLGYERDLADRVRADDVLRKRSDNLERFGDWLPATLADGSWYVIRRLLHVDVDSDLPILSADEFAAAEELLT